MDIYIGSFLLPGRGCFPEMLLINNGILLCRGGLTSFSFIFNVKVKWINIRGLLDIQCGVKNPMMLKVLFLKRVTYFNKFHFSVKES